MLTCLTNKWSQYFLFLGPLLFCVATKTTGTGDCGNHAKDVAEKSDNDHIIGKLIQPTIQPEDAADQSYCLQPKL